MKEIVNFNPFSWIYETLIVNIKSPINVRLFGNVLVGDASTCNVAVNNVDVWTQFNLFEATYPIDIDVTSYILSGDNSFRIGVSNLGGGIFTLSIQITYQAGTEEPGPAHPPVTLPWWWWIPVLFVGGVVVYYVFKPKERGILLVR